MKEDMQDYTEREYAQSKTMLHLSSNSRRIVLQCQGELIYSSPSSRTCSHLGYKLEGVILLCQHEVHYHFIRECAQARDRPTAHHHEPSGSRHLHKSFKLGVKKLKQFILNLVLTIATLPSLRGSTTQPTKPTSTTQQSLAADQSIEVDQRSSRSSNTTDQGELKHEAKLSSRTNKQVSRTRSTK